MRILALLVAITSLAVANVSARDPYLLRDLEPTFGKESSSPRFLGETLPGDVRLFAVGRFNKELWRTDGTSAGTWHIADEVSVFNSLGQLAGREIFVGLRPGNGARVLSSDGSAQPPRELATIRVATQSASTFPRRGVEYRGSFFFPALHPTDGFELWRTDGTTTGTSHFDLKPGSEGVDPRGLVVFDGRLFFMGEHPTGLTFAVYRSDGTLAGTEVVRNGSLRSSAIFGSKLIFASQDEQARHELCVLDSADSQPRSVRTFGANAPVDVIAAFERGVFLKARESTTGTEVWVSDGTAEGTRILVDFAAGTASSLPEYLGRLGSRHLFSLQDETGVHWIVATDGTPSGTYRVAARWAGESFILRDKFYFLARTPESGLEFWQTDGSATGTSIVRDIVPGPEDGISYEASRLRKSAVGKNEFVFAAFDSVQGEELWVSDGSSAGTRVLANLRPDPGAGSDPRLLRDVGSTVMFLTSRFLWRTDGTSEGTVSLGDATLDLVVSGAVGGTSYFWVAGDRQLWRSDGTATGTFALTQGERVTSLQRFRDGVLFIADEKLWFSNGTRASTLLLANQVVCSQYRDCVLVVGDVAFFGRADRSVWRTDATPHGTRQFLDPQPNRLTARAAIDGVLYLTLEFGTGGTDTDVELWRTDGTVAGTYRIERFEKRGRTLALVGLPSKLLISLGTGIWVTDGRPGAARQLVQAKPFCAGTTAMLDGRLFWIGSGALWTSDGSDSGTVRLASVTVSDRFCTDGSLYAAEHRLYFEAADAEHGFEPWVSDGTSAGTRLLFDINPGPASSSPGDFIQLGDLLLFRAKTFAAGSELWAYRVIARADLSLSVAFVDLSPTGAITFEATVRNLGPEEATDVAVTLPLAGAVLHAVSPSVGSCTTKPSAIVCSLGTLSNGATASIRFTVTPPGSPFSYRPVLTVSSSSSDSNGSNNTVAMAAGEADVPALSPIALAILFACVAAIAARRVL